MVRARNLEPSILFAILESPLSSSLIEINSSASQINPIILIQSHTNRCSILLKDWQLKGYISGGYALQQVAHISSASILNAFSEDICNIEHKVKSVGLVVAKY
jgi:hypothetical protein